MGLESTVNIAGLDSNWPISGDVVQEGDDHLKLIKSVLKNIFPGTGGAGFATPITATEAELNALTGITAAGVTKLMAITASASELNLLAGKTLSSGDDVIDNFPAGTKMVFVQAAAPSGWAIDATKNDRVLRVNSASGGAVGGSWTLSGISVNGHTLSIAEMPQHQHKMFVDGYVGYTNSPGAASYISEGGYGRGQDWAYDMTATGGAGTPDTGVNELVGGGGSHTHGVTLGDSWRPSYVDSIICTKS